MSSNFSLAPGFHAVVIGGAGDIGAAISNELCDLGAAVTATGANDADLARSRLKPRGGLSLATSAAGVLRRQQGQTPVSWHSRNNSLR